MFYVEAALSKARLWRFYRDQTGVDNSHKSWGWMPRQHKEQLLKKFD
jgi:hypothetical protein